MHKIYSSASIFEKGISTLLKVGKLFGIVVTSSGGPTEGQRSCLKLVHTYFPILYCFYTMSTNFFFLICTITSFVRESILDTSAASTKDFEENFVQAIEDMCYHFHIFGTTMFGMIKCRDFPRVFQQWRCMEAHLKYYEHIFATKQITNKKKWEKGSILVKEMAMTSETTKQHARFIRKCTTMTITYVLVAMFGSALYFLYEYEKNNRPPTSEYLVIASGIYTIDELQSEQVGIFILYFGEVLELLWAFGDMLLLITSFSLRYQFQRFNKVLHLACTEHAENLHTLSLENLRQLHWALVKVIKETTKMLNSITIVVFVCNIIYLFARVHLGLSEDFSSPRPVVVLEASFEFLYLIVRIFLTSCMAAAFHSITTEGVLYFSRANLDVLRNETFFHLLERFRSQIFSANVGISGNGYFLVNQAFVATVASALITYQVLIVQLQIGQSSTKTNATESAPNGTVAT